MQVIGQDHRSDDFERAPSTCHAERAAQVLDVLHQQRAIPLLQVHREEIGSTRNQDAAVIGHEPIMAFGSPDSSHPITLVCVGKP